MNCIFLTIGLMIFGTTPDGNITKDMEHIAKVIHEFSSNVDQRNIKQVDKILHQEYRSVVNRLFGSEEVSIMDKALYLNLLKQEKIGGDSRSVKIHSIDIDGNNAVVRVTLTGKELIFTTFIQLVKNTSGNWSVISDMPTIEKKG